MPTQHATSTSDAHDPYNAGLVDFVLMVTPVAMLLLNAMLCFGSLFAYDAPGSEFNSGLNGFVWTVWISPFVIFLGMVIYLGLVTNGTSRRVAGVALYAVLSVVLACAVGFGIAGAYKNPLELDDFGEGPPKQLIQACIKNDLGELKKLLDTGISPNVSGKRGINPLYVAVMNENVEMLRMLLRAGADPNDMHKELPVFYAPLTVINMSFDAPDKRQLQNQLFEILLEHGLDVNTRLGKRFGHKPLLWCAIHVHADEIVQVLLARGAKTKVDGVDPTSALEYAVLVNDWTAATQLAKNATPEELRSLLQSKKYQRRLTNRWDAEALRQFEGVAHARVATLEPTTTIAPTTQSQPEYDK